MIVISAAAPSTIAASTTWPLPERAALDQRARDAEREQHAAAAEVADQVQRRRRRLAAPADRSERAGERDVVDVVARGVRERALLAPARHAAVDQARVAREADVGAEPEPLHHARAEALDQRVGAARPAQHGGDALGVLQIDADAAPAAREEVASAARRIARRHEPARSMRSTSAPMSESIIAGERSRADACDLENANSSQGTHGELLFAAR